MAASAWNAAPALARDLLGDERLARHAARGDQQAFAALFSRYQRDLERYCRSILRNGHDAEDAAQNAMLAAHRALEAGTIPMRVKPWLYRIAHNEAITLARRRRPSEELDDRAVGAIAGPEEAGAVRERLGQLMSDLKSLTERQREALVLRELFGLSYTEIAQTLGASEGAAMQTVFEARSALMAFGEGRAMECEQIQRAMSECDGMRLRTRRYRAHVRGCDGCREFEASLLARRRDLGLLFPPAGGAGGLLAALARLLGLGGGGDRLAAALGLKGAVVGVALLAGGGALIAGTQQSGPRAAPAGFVSQPSAGPAGGAAPAKDGSAPSARTRQQGNATKRAPAKHGHTTTKATNPASSPGAQAPAGSATSQPTEVASTNASTTASHGQSRGGSTGGSATGPVPGHSKPANAVNQAVSSVGQTVDSTVNQVTDTANTAVGDVSNTIGQTTTTATGAVDNTVTTATDVIKKVGGGVGLP